MGRRWLTGRLCQAGRFRIVKGADRPRRERNQRRVERWNQRSLLWYRGGCYRRSFLSIAKYPHADFEAAAEIAVDMIRQILVHQGNRQDLYNINIPTAATQSYRKGVYPEVHCVPMGVERYGDHYIKRQDPKGRNYYWSTNDPPPRPTDHETDLNALAAGHVTLTPLQFDMTKHALLNEMQAWGVKLGST